MTTSPPRPVCFIAMPFGKKTPPGADAPLVDFNAVHAVIEAAIKDAELEPVRADYEHADGFIHRAMYERLLVAEYVIADLSFANNNVAYEVGVRHGARAGATIMICAETSLSLLGFDLRPLRIIPYSMDGGGAERLRTTLTERLKEALAGDRPDDNPIVQVTRLGAVPGPEHQKTDVFLQRIKFAEGVVKEIAEAIAQKDSSAAIGVLSAIETRVLAQPRVVRELHTALIALLLGYREKKAYDRMVALYDRLEPELKSTAVAREQVALAHNRIAEQLHKEKKTDDAAEQRSKALAVLEPLLGSAATSETCSILGRIHKGWFDALAGDQVAPFPPATAAQLDAAIDAYERGFRIDPRDYYPGVNLVTLLIQRAGPEDEQTLARRTPVVEFAVERSPAAKDNSERYWQTATKMELAAAARDWKRAHQTLVKLLGIPGTQAWMFETSAKNLLIQKRARAQEAETVAELTKLIEQLNAK